MHDSMKILQFGLSIWRSMNKLVKHRRKFFLSGAHHLFNYFAILEELERWHSVDPTQRLHLVGLVHIHLDKSISVYSSDNA
jgi:hypothetical protein